MNLESFLNVVIPLGIFVFLAAAVWWRLKEPMSAFFKWLGELFGWTRDKLSESVSEVNAPVEIVYR